MEAEGIIEASDSPWSSPLVILTKKNGDLRVCMDYRAINQVMRKSAVPLPKIQECLDSLSGSTYFCTMDLAQGYYQKLQCTHMTNVRLHSPQKEG